MLCGSPYGETAPYRVGIIWGMSDLAYWARNFFQAFFLFSFEVGFSLSGFRGLRDWKLYILNLNRLEGLLSILSFRCVLSIGMDLYSGVGLGRGSACLSVETVARVWMMRLDWGAFVPVDNLSSVFAYFYTLYDDGVLRSTYAWYSLRCFGVVRSNWYVLVFSRTYLEVCYNLDLAAFCKDVVLHVERKRPSICITMSV